MRLCFADQVNAMEVLRGANFLAPRGRRNARSDGRQCSVANDSYGVNGDVSQEILSSHMDRQTVLPQCVARWLPKWFTEICYSYQDIGMSYSWQSPPALSGCQGDGSDPVWEGICGESKQAAEEEPLLSSYLYASVASHPTLESSLAFVLANLLADETLQATQLVELFQRTMRGANGNACIYLERGVK